MMHGENRGADLEFVFFYLGFQGGHFIAHTALRSRFKQVEIEKVNDS